ncbi:FecR family protein [Candidatus Bathyarchaeota archaeon]|nr:FecR family protein [Candidatus Bathyarchaeota archaeon]
MNKNKIDTERITRFFKGDSAEDASQYIKEVFCDREKVKELDDLMRRIWYDLLSKSDLKEDKIDHVLYRIHYEINTKMQKSKQTISRFVKWFSRVAAILVLPLILYSGIHFYRTVSNKGDSSWVEIKTPAWTRSQFSLPDGTQGWLNSNSSIRYNGNFNNNREVILSGEAFFDVKKESKKPFKVNTGEITVTALGTRYNIASYENEKSIEVALEEGKLLFNNKKMNKSYLMKPNDCIIYDKKLNDFTVKRVEPETYYSWTMGKLVFRNDSLDAVARRLERCYNIEVEVRGDLTKQPRLRATFVDENLEEILKLLKLSLPIIYKINPQQLKEDGTYSKTKVTITIMT